MSWKSQGGSGINKQDVNNNIHVDSIVTDTLSVRQGYKGLFDIIGDLNVNKLVNITGNVTAESNIFVYENIEVSGNIIEKNDIILYNNIYFGSDLSNYMFGDMSGIGVNNSNPNASFDICGNRSEVLNVYSNQPITRNTLAQNNTNKGIQLIASDTSSSIYFFNDNSLNTLQTQNTVYNGKIEYTSGGNLILDVSNNTEILSKLTVSNRNTKQNIILDPSLGHINNETVAIYDICGGFYLPDVYGTVNNYTGNALSLISSDNSSNTFLNIQTPTKHGVSIGGGAYMNDKNRSVGIIGVNDNSGAFIQAQTIVSSNSLNNYPFTIGINTYSPRTEQYILDINGPMHITNGFIKQVYSQSSVINKIWCLNNGNCIAVGNTINNIPTLLFSNNSSKTWNLALNIPSNVNNLNAITLYYINNTKSAIIILSQNTYLYTIDNGKNYTQFSVSLPRTDVFPNNIFILQVLSITLILVLILLTI